MLSVHLCRFSGRNIRTHKWVYVFKISNSKPRKEKCNPHERYTYVQLDRNIWSICILLWSTLNSRSFVLSKKKTHDPLTLFGGSEDNQKLQYLTRLTANPGQCGRLTLHAQITRLANLCSSICGRENQDAILDANLKDRTIEVWLIK